MRPSPSRLTGLRFHVQEPLDKGHGKRLLKLPQPLEKILSIELLRSGQDPARILDVAGASGHKLRRHKGVRPLYLDLVEDAVLLFDRDGFFAGALEHLRRSLRRTGVRRLRLGKIRYWDLKPDLVPGEIFEI